MANIVNRNFNSVSVTYDTELKNQLGDKAIFRDAKKVAIGDEGYYFADGSNTVLVLFIGDDNLKNFGEPATVPAAEATADVKKIKDNVYYAAATTAGWTELKAPIEVTFANGKATFDIKNLDK